MIAVADPWATRASSLPLAFAQVREDPRLDLELARQLPMGETVVMIASGGETAVCLGRLPLNLHLVDMNPAQLALARVKWHLAEEVDPRDSMELLGYLPMEPEERNTRLVGILNGLELEGDILGSPHVIACYGPDQSGRYEVTFAELRRELAICRGELDRALGSEVPVTNLDSTPLGHALDEAFAKVMSLENLVCLFGHEATQNPRMSFSNHFAGRTRLAFERTAPASNPFLWQILAGKFPPGCPYDWLMESGAPLTPHVRWHHGKMAVVLESFAPESVGMVHLSNILDWLSPDDARATLQTACRVLKPGGKVIIRQLNSTLDIPTLDSGFVWDPELGKAMEARDHSYFYPGIHVGTRA